MRLLLLLLAVLLAAGEPDAQALVQDPASGLWGVQAEDGTWLTAPTYDAVERPWTDREAGDVYVRVHAEGGMGLLRNGRLILPTRFETIGSEPNFQWQPHLFFLAAPRILAETPEGTKGLYLLDGTEVMAPVHEDIDPAGIYVRVYVGPFETHLYTLDGERVGEEVYATVSYACAETGAATPQTSTTPDGVYAPDRDVLVVRRTRGAQVELLRASDRVPVTRDRFDGVSTMAGVIATVRRRGERRDVSLIGYDGRVRLAGPFDEARSLAQPMPTRYVAVRRGDRWRVADIEAGTLSEAAVEDIGSPRPFAPESPERTFFLAREGGLWGAIDPTGAWLIPPSYDTLSAYRPTSHTLAARRGDETVRLPVGEPEAGGE